MQIANVQLQSMYNPKYSNLHLASTMPHEIYDKNYSEYLSPNI